MESFILWFKECSYKNKNLVGGKCSSLGELHNLSQKINFNIADGFALTTNFYDIFLEQNNLTSIIENKLNNIDTEDIEKLEVESEELRNLILNSNFTIEQEKIILENYNLLCGIYHKENLEVAIRSSAIAEDLPNASFAGQQDTYLNISGYNSILLSIKKCFASLFNSRAVSYRKRYNIQISDVKISVAVQKMVRSDIGSAGVSFSIDPESGYDKAIVINSSFGLGELVVSGGVKPDEFILDKRVLKHIDGDPIIMKKIGDKQSKIVYSQEGGTMEIETNLIEKLNFSLTNNQAITLARFVLLLEDNYSKMFDKKLGVDVEWAIDGYDQKIYIIQTRPETVHSSNLSSNLNIKRYILDQSGKKLLKGIAVGDKISSGKIKILKSIKEHKKFNEGDILVTDFTTPDFEPVMKIASGLITNKGGRTSHAAIISREFGLNCIVGCGSDINILKDDDIVTISCCEGEEGHVYEGTLKYHIDEININSNLKLPLKLMLNVGNPEASFSNSQLPNSGVGLARMEFIINNYIGIHPKALIDYPAIREDVREEIYNIIGDHDNGRWYFIKRLARGIAKIAAPFYPNDVIVRLSDFKSNEYRNLLGGELYEPIEENALLGWRGASRYYSKDYEDAFALECEALKYAREEMKMSNIIIMIPFCRTTEECILVIDKMASHGLVRGKDGLQIYIMCEIISNVIEAEEFSPLIDGVSIGGNDLLMLTVGADRDNEVLSSIASDTNLSYRRLIQMAITTYKKNGIKVGFCGNQVSSSTEFCKFLIDAGIDSISVTSDVCLQTIVNLGK
jgi:pyruvate,water dikinase